MDESSADDASASDQCSSDVETLFSDTSGREKVTRLRTTINDLPDEIILRIMNDVFVILGPKMYIFDFPTPAAVCQKWFMIYFEMYWKRWGFLQCKKATVDEWLQLARARNGVSPHSKPTAPTLAAAEENPVVVAPKSATPPPPLTKPSDVLEGMKSEMRERPMSLSLVETAPMLSKGFSAESAGPEIVDGQESRSKNVWKTVSRRNKKPRSKDKGLVNKKTEAGTPAGKPKVAAFPFKIMRILA